MVGIVLDVAKLFSFRWTLESSSRTALLLLLNSRFRVLLCNKRRSCFLSFFFFSVSLLIVFLNVKYVRCHATSALLCSFFFCCCFASYGDIELHTTAAFVCWLMTTPLSLVKPPFYPCYLPSLLHIFSFFFL